MKRIAIAGLNGGENILAAKALATMCGYDLSISPSFSLTAIRYGLSMDMKVCQWPDSWVYCLGAFTERIVTEQRYGEKFVSDGSVLKELVWLKCRYPRVEPIYEQAMIHSLERVVAVYAAKNYDIIFHAEVLSETDTAGVCLRRLCETYHIPCRAIDFSDRENALQVVADCLQVTPKMSAAHSLSKALRELSSPAAVYSSGNPAEKPDT
ncbi:MAG: hypothetical protein LBB90_02885 [Tannerella sp.]|jgi:hypothetical protein|nr:hypothetical protein [Tannerella sp.]